LALIIETNYSLGDETAFLRFRPTDPKWTLPDFVEILKDWEENNPNRTVEIRRGEP